MSITAINFQDKAQCGYLQNNFIRGDKVALYVFVIASYILAFLILHTQPCFIKNIKVLTENIEVRS